MKPIYQDWIFKFISTCGKLIAVVNELQQLLTEYNRRDLDLSTLTDSQFLDYPDLSHLSSENLLAAIAGVTRILQSPTEDDKKVIYRVMR